VTQAAGSTVNAGLGTILVDGGGNPINLGTGTLSTTNASAAAVTIQNGTTATLGNVTATTGTLNLGVIGLTLSGAITANGGTTLNVLNISVAGGSFTVPSGLTLNGTLTVVSGTTTAGGPITIANIAISAGATLDSASQSITVSASWSNSGTFVQGTGTVSFNGAGSAVISGNTTFYNFSCAQPGKTIKFTNGTTQTITGMFTITGLAQSLVSLLSTASPAQWIINPSASSNVAYALVQDSQVQGANIITANTSGDNGNNTIAPPAPGWEFSASTLTWTGAAGTSWNNGNNWDGGYVPNRSDSATIADVGSQPATLNSNTTIVNLTINNGASTATGTNNLTLTGNLAVNGGGGTLDAGGGGNVAVAGATVTFAAGSVYTAGAGTFTFNRGGAQSLTSSTNTLGAAATAGAGTNLTLVDNASFSSLSVVSGTTLTASAGIAITVSGSVSIAGSFAPSSSVIVLTGGSTSFTVPAGGLTINGLTMSKAAGGNLATLAGGGLTINGVLTMTTGTLVITGQTLTLGQSLTIGSANATITVDTGTLSAGTNSITVNAGSITQSSGTISAAGLTVGGGIVSSSGTGVLTVGAGGITMSSGTLNLGNDAASTSGNVGVTAGTFNAGTSTLTMSGAGTTIQFAAGGPNNLTISAAGTVRVTGSPLTVGAALAVNGGATLRLGGFALTVGSDLTGAGTLTATASEAIGVGGNWNIAIFNPSTSSVSFTGGSGAGPFTVTSNGQSFSTVVLTAAGKTYQQNGAANITASLTLTAGTWSTNGAGLTVGANLTGAGALTATASEAIGVGADFTPGAFTAANSTVTLNTGANGNVSGLSFYNLVFGKTAVGATVTSMGGLTVTNALTLTEGTWAQGVGFTHTIAGSWDSSSTNFTLSAGSSTVDLSPTPIPGIKVKAADSFYNLTVSNDGSMTAGSATLTVGNNLLISGGTLTLNGIGLSVGAALSGAGALTATAFEAISAGGSWSITTFAAASSTVTFTSIESVQTAVTFYNLTIAASANVTLQANIGINNTLSLNGTLGAGAYTITMNGAQWNNVGTFNPGSGTVAFTLQNAAQLTIMGNNSWYDFTVSAASAAGKTIQFQHLMTQTINAGGLFTVLGSSSSLITLTTDNPIAATNTTPPPSLQGQWVIANNGTPPNVNNVTVMWSYATNPIIPGANANDGGNNHNWIFSIPIVASWTLDTLNSGRINRIRVQVLPATQLNNGFAGFTAQVNGYTVTGYQQVPGTDVFDILLQQGPQEDTNATPTWQVTANTTLASTTGGALVAHNTAGTTKLYVAASGARPVITYTLAALGSTQAYVHFSEPVYGADNGTTSINAASLSYSGGAVTVQPVETNGGAAHAAIVTLPLALAVNDILAGAKTISAATVAGTGQIWSQQVYPTTFNYPSNFPSASQTHSSGNPGAYGNTDPDGNLPPSVTAIAPFSGRAMLTPSSSPGPTALAHNISDVGIGFVTPVLAEDQSITRDPTRGGVGVVTIFDGSQWLPPQSTFLEAGIAQQVLTADPLATNLTLFWDINPPAANDFNNLWIPTGASTLWPGNLSGDRAHSPADPQATSVLSSASNGALRDFIIPANSSAIKDGALFQFVFLLSDGTYTLPCAFLGNPANPASARPFEYMFHSIIQQRGGVTITNNVIRPDNGQSAFVQYTVTTPGPVTILVFGLSGSTVNVLQQGSQSPGQYTTAWNGKNRGGRSVARGIYFIRVVGPGFDEIRKVLVVR
jgi:hypothetical protein